MMHVVAKRNENSQTQKMGNEKREKDGHDVPFNVEHELGKVKICVPLIELDKTMSIINQSRK